MQQANSAQEDGFVSFVQQTWKLGLLCVTGLSIESGFHAFSEAFYKAWLSKFCTFSEVDATLLTVVGRLWSIPFTVGVLVLVDTIGVGKTGAIAAGTFLAASVPMWYLPYTWPHSIFAVQVGVGLLWGGTYGLKACFIPFATELFPAGVRSRAMGFYGSIGFVNSGVIRAICSTRPLAPMWCCLGFSLFTCIAFLYANISHRKTEGGIWLKVATIRPELY